MLIKCEFIINDMHGHSEKLEKFTASKSYPCILIGKLKTMVDPGWDGSRGSSSNEW